MRRARLPLVLGLLGLGGIGGVAALSACGATFDPQSKVDSVRMFAVRADKPYAKPGENVTLEALITDARKTKNRPLKLFWIPFVCMNPRDDLYYLCFVPPGAGIDGGATFIPAGMLADAGIEGGAGGDGGGGSGSGGAGVALDGGIFSIPPGTDLSPFLPQGTTFGFRMPDDAIQPRSGIDPYGLAVVFNVACAGRIELAQRDPAAGPQQVPILCVDEQGEQVPPSDYVIGISRVYSYATRVNTNPVIEKMTKDGVDVDVSAGLTVDHCTTEAKENCPDIKLDVRVSDSSWEENPDESGQLLHEQIWVDYYSDQGEVGSDARLLFDTRLGRVEGSEMKFHAPQVAAEGTLWAVVHDNRGGVSWLVVPLHAN